MPKIRDGLIFIGSCSTSLLALIKKLFGTSTLEDKRQIDEEVRSSNSINLNLALIQFISGQ
jgi:hypothetical protein